MGLQLRHVAWKINGTSTGTSNGTTISGSCGVIIFNSCDASIVWDIDKRMRGHRSEEAHNAANNHHADDAVGKDGDSWKQVGSHNGSELLKRA